MRGKRARHLRYLAKLATNCAPRRYVVGKHDGRELHPMCARAVYQRMKREAA